MALETSVTESDIFTALRRFLLSILWDGTEVIQGQANRVASPKSPRFVVMTMLNRTRLATNVDRWDVSNPHPEALDISHSTQAMVQLDFHGDGSADQAQMVATMLRDYYGCDNFGDGRVTPLYSDDPKQLPFINAENQYENRWVLSVALQVNPGIVTPQEFADIVIVQISNAEGS